MAKTIKFNLICDEKPIRTIDDLQNNFSIEDILSYYNNNLLHRWLKVRGYEKELDAVSKITSKEPMDIVKQLISIFNVVLDEKEVEESIYVLEYLNEKKEMSTTYDAENYKVESIIDDYFKGYHQLVVDIINNPKDVSIIKANIKEMISNYRLILEIDNRHLFYILKDHSPLAIMCFLMNEESRKYYLPITHMDESGNIILDIEENFDKKTMFNEICLMIKSSSFINELGENIISFSGFTDGYWKDLEPKGKKYMIISMGVGDYVRSSGQSKGDLNNADITNQFVILDGIDYKSNNSTRKLLYMEV